MNFIHFILTGLSNCVLVRRIVDGKTLNAHPWMVFLNGPRTYCGGTLYTESLVISAARCNRYSVNDWKAYVNIKYIRPLDPFKGSKHKIIYRENHPKYHNKSCEYDISVWWIDGKSNTFTNIYLDNRVKKKDEKGKVIILGWGDTAKKTPEQKRDSVIKKLFKYELQASCISIVSNSICIVKYRKHFNPYNMLCVENEFSGSGASTGDRGGPALRIINGKIYLVGVISLTNFRNYRNSHDFYVRIATKSTIKFINYYASFFTPNNYKTKITPVPWKK